MASDIVVSHEQAFAVRQIANGESNLVLDAVAGSGKSTTILSLAKELPGRRILQLTYNATLRKEIQKKVADRDIKNLEVHTFHSLAVKYYLTSAHTDTGLRKILLTNMRPRNKIPEFDIVVLDETQDMSFLYYQFITKMTFDMGSCFQMFILGDFMQGIYEFKGADVRSLLFASRIWRNHPRLKSREFVECTLNTSYRVTRQIARFVNVCMLGEERLVAQKDGPPVLYLTHKSKQLEVMVIWQINRWLSTGVSPGDIFVLGASVKRVNSNIRKMENTLVEKGVPCFVPMLDTESLDDRVIEGKVTFSTFHSVKGRERPYVIVMGFDHSYFFYASNLPVDECPNTLYVACTRATHQLVLLEKNDFRNDQPLKFLKRTHKEMIDEKLVEFKGMPRTNFYEDREALLADEKKEKDKFRDVSPTDLVRFIPEHTLEAISPLLDNIFIQEAEPDEMATIDIPNVIETSRGGFEDVSDLNGIAIPCMYYDHLFRLYEADADTDKQIGVNILKHVINECLCDTKDHELTELKTLVDQMPEKCHEPADYYMLSNLFVAAKERLLFKWKQIAPEDYNWFHPAEIEKCMNRLDDIIWPECSDAPPKVEHTIICRDMEAEQERANVLLAPFFPDNEKKFRFTAIIDLTTRRTLMELKFTSVLSVENRLQLVLYAWLWNIVYTPDLGKKRAPTCLDPRESRLFNVKTGERLRLNATFEDLTTIVVELLRGRYDTEQPKSDEEFLYCCDEFMREYSESVALIE
jgi:hypothetical protein